MYFYNARYYNPVLGRFISPDALVPQPGNPQSFNRYSYVTNNPATLVDPSGHGIWDYEADLAQQQASILVISQIIMDTWFLPPVTNTGAVLGANNVIANTSYISDATSFGGVQFGGAQGIPPAVPADPSTMYSGATG